MVDLPMCTVTGCENKVSKTGFKLCMKHWRIDNKKTEEIKDEATDNGIPAKENTHLNSTQLAEHFGLSAKKINQVLLELGWIEPALKGWMPTTQGKKLLAQEHEYHKTGASFVVWPKSIKTSNILKRGVEEYKGASTVEAVLSPKEVVHEYTLNFRNKFPSKYRTSDGHQVRSRAELAIDNWLYQNRVIHVYEKMLPIEEEVYSDFYIREGNVYIEYWGMEKDQKYLARKQVKQEIYAKYEFNLIELDDKHIENLDDYLPKFLLKYGVVVD